MNEAKLIENFFEWIIYGAILAVKIAFVLVLAVIILYAGLFIFYKVKEKRKKNY